MKKKKPEEMTNDELRKALGLVDDPAYAGNLSPGEISKFVKEMENNELQPAWDDFDILMARIPDYLEQLRKLLENSKNYHSPRIDFSKNSDELYEDERAFQDQTIERVENFFLDVLRGKEPYEDDIDELKLIIGLFLGEAIVEKLDGEWMICENKDFADYGKPLVALWEDNDFGPPLNPFGVVALLAQLKRKGVLNGAIRGMEQGSKG